MAQKFYIGDYGGPLSVDVFAADGVTPVLPVSATIDIINMDTGTLIVDDGTCFVQSGLASYVIPQSSPATTNAGRYVGYISVLIETGNLQTEEVYYNVFNKTSYLILERWRAKVIDSSIDDDHVDDDAAREWIDQATAWISRRLPDFGYTSVLGAVTPTATAADMEFIANVASLMARSAWWAGKGNWHDAEMSFNGTPFEMEWKSLDDFIADKSAEEWFDTAGDGTMYNRDKVYYPGIKWDSATYWHRDSGDPEPITEIPV